MVMVFCKKNVTVRNVKKSRFAATRLGGGGCKDKPYIYIIRHFSKNNYSNHPFGLDELLNFNKFISC